MNATLTAKNFEDVPIKSDSIKWTLKIDGVEYPCKSQCVMNYEDAVKMMLLAKCIEGTVCD